MEVPALRMHASRALYADKSLDIATAELRRLFRVSLVPASKKTQRALQSALAVVQMDLFDDYWGIGSHRAFQNAFKALMLQPQANRELWDDVYKRCLDARVLIRQTLFAKQTWTQEKMPVNTSTERLQALNFLQTDFNGMYFSSIDEADTAASTTAAGQVMEDDLDDPEEGIDSVLNSF